MRRIGANTVNGNIDGKYIELYRADGSTALYWIESSINLKFIGSFY